MLIVAGLVAATQMSWNSVVPVLPGFARSMGATLAQVGLVISAFGVGRLAVNLPAGRLCEVRNTRRILLWAVVANAVLGAVAGFSATFEQLLVLRLLTGVAGGAAITAGNVLIGTVAGAGSRARSLSVLQSMQLGSSALGPGLGGVVASVFGARAAFASSGAVALAFVAWAVVRLPDGGTAPRRMGERPSTSVVTAPFVAVCIVGFAVFFLRFGQQAILPVLGQEVFDVGPGALGVVLSAVGVANIALVAVVGGLSDRVGRRAVIIPSLAGTAVLALGYAVAPNAVAFYAVILAIGLLTAFNGPTPVAYLADVVPAVTYGRAVGAYRTFGDLASLAAPVALTTLLATSGVGATAILFSAVAGGAAAIFWWLAPETVATPPRLAALSKEAA